jgi:hypothetical protein
VTDWVDYSGALSSRPALPGTGPTIQGSAPLLSGSGLASIDVIFSEPIDQTTFGVSDVVVSGPQSSVATQVTLLGTSIYRITLATPLTQAGLYQVRVGPAIANLAGVRMDQDGDGRDGETAEDAYVALVTVDTAGPRVVAQTPSGSVDQALQSLVLEFDEPVAVGSFGPEDIRILLGQQESSPFPGFLVTSYQSRLGLSSLSAALQTLAGNWTQLTASNASNLDLWEGGNFGVNPSAFAIAGNNVVSVFLGTVTIPTAGDWTFAVSSDDGFRLRVNGAEVAFDGGRGASTTPDLLVVNFAAAGTYQLEVLHFNGGHPEALEVSAAPGSLVAFSSDFKVVGDVAGGGLAVSSVRVPASGIPIYSVVPINPQTAVVYPPRPDSFNGAGFAVRAVFANRGVTDVSVAQEVLDTPTQQGRVAWANTALLNFGYDGSFSTSNLVAPGLDAGQGADGMILEATARISIPTAGEWTFGVNSDDGFRLTVGGNAAEYPTPRALGTTLATWTFAAAGEYDLRLVYFNTSGPFSVELFAAQGKHEAFNENFRLVGDAALGGLSVRSDTVVSDDRPVGSTGQVATRFLVQFEPISTNGTYLVEVGPGATDAVGNRMDQDRDGTNGETVQDLYRGQIVMDRKPFRIPVNHPQSRGQWRLDPVGSDLFRGGANWEL